MSRLTFFVALFLAAAPSFGAEKKHSFWCDTRVKGDPKTYMVTFNLIQDLDKGTCTAKGDAGEFGASFDHEFTCRMEATEAGKNPIFRIELDVLTTTDASGNPDRDATAVRIYSDLDARFSHGLVRLKDGSVLPLTCVP